MSVISIIIHNCSVFGIPDIYDNYLLQYLETTLFLIFHELYSTIFAITEISLFGFIFFINNML